MADQETYLDKFFMKDVQLSDGSILPSRKKMRFLGGTSAPIDNPTLQTTDIPLAASGGGGGGAGQGTTNIVASSVTPVNSNVPTLAQPTIRMTQTGTSGPFALGGFDVSPSGGPFTAPVAGAKITVINTTSQVLTVVHEDTGSAAVLRIDTGSGGPVTMPPRRGRLDFVYDGTSSRWTLEHGGRFYGTLVDVRDFGTVGDGVADDTAAFQAASAYMRSILSRYNGVLPAYALPKLIGATLYVPTGCYKLSATFELFDGCKMSGDGFGSVLLGASSSVVLCRSEAYHTTIEDIFFVGGKYAVAYNGPFSGGGSFGTVTAQATNIIRGCFFQGQAGHSIILDTTIEERDSAAKLIVEGCFFYGGAFVRGFWDQLVMRDDYLWPWQDGSNGLPIVHDDNGKLAPAIVNMGGLVLDSNTIVPGAGLDCLIAGFGQIQATNNRFGGENTYVLMRTTHSQYKFDGQVLTALYTGTGGDINRPELNFDASTLSGCSGKNWLEIYDVMPLLIHITSILPTVDTGFSPPSAPLILANSHGVWIDATSLPQANYIKTERENITIHLGVYSSGADFVFRTSTDPSLLLGHSGVTDVTPQLRQYMTGVQANHGSEGQFGIQPNLWRAGIVQLSQADITSVSSGSLVNGVLETQTGYSIQGVHPTVDGVTLIAVFNNIFTSALSAGDYTITFEVNSAKPLQVQLHQVDATGGTNPIPRDTFYHSGGGWQSFKTTIRWDGTTFGGGTASGVRFVVPSMYSTVDLFLGKFGLWSGAEPPRQWGYPGNSNATGLVTDRNYYLPTTPTAGTWRAGDVVWNTIALVGQPIGWVCIRGGSYGGAIDTSPKWAAFGTVLFDPSQVPGYNAHYESGTLAGTPGAVTTWPSKFGLVATQASFQLAGTATAHANGGSNGGPWVEFVRASANVMHEDNQSSTLIAKEVWMVARYTTTGGTNGTIYDGGVGNDSRVYRPSADHIQYFGLGPFAVPTGLVEQWAVWRMVADGTNVSLYIAGLTILAPTALATFFQNGVTLGNFGAGAGDAADAGFEEVILFTQALSPLNVANMYAYLNTKWGLIATPSGGGSVTNNSREQASNAAVPSTAGPATVTDGSAYTTNTGKMLVIAQVNVTVQSGTAVGRFAGALQMDGGGVNPGGFECTSWAVPTDSTTTNVSLTCCALVTVTPGSSHTFGIQVSQIEGASSMAFSIAARALDVTIIDL